MTTGLPVLRVYNRLVIDKRTSICEFDHMTYTPIADRGGRYMSLRNRWRKMTRGGYTCAAGEQYNDKCEHADQY